MSKPKVLASIRLTVGHQAIAVRLLKEKLRAKVITVAEAKMLLMLLSHKEDLDARAERLRRELIRRTRRLNQ